MCSGHTCMPHDFKDSFFKSVIVFILVCIYEEISLPIQQKHAGEVSFFPACLPVCEDLVFTMAAFISLHQEVLYYMK